MKNLWKGLKLKNKMFFKMKNNNGITLNTLVMYIIATTILLTLIGKMTSNLYTSTKKIDAKTIDVAYLNRVNTYLLKESKYSGNKVYEASDNGVIFTSGNVISYKDDNKLYYNTTQICNDITTCKFHYDDNTKVITLVIEFNNLSEQTLNYKLEEIY